jgi:hypothetical protein
MGSRFHLSKPAVILSGIGFYLFQGLITGPPVLVAFGTAKPDNRHETGHCSMPISMRKCLIFALFPPLSAYFRIPYNIAADSHNTGRQARPTFHIRTYTG